MSQKKICVNGKDRSRKICSFLVFKIRIFPLYKEHVFSKYFLKLICKLCLKHPRKMLVFFSLTEFEERCSTIMMMLESSEEGGGRGA